LSYVDENADVTSTDDTAVPTVCVLTKTNPGWLTVQPLIVAAVACKLVIVPKLVNDDDTTFEARVVPDKSLAFTFVVAVEPISTHAESYRMNVRPVSDSYHNSPATGEPGGVSEVDKEALVP
jgi:hypothetical protein